MRVVSLMPALPAIFAGCALSASCATPPPPSFGAVPVSEGAARERAAEDILMGSGVNTAALGVMKDGELSWSMVWGEVRPGVPATSRTRLNVASITKTVTAETVLRMAADGEVDLDEPLARSWIDPDVADDPKAEKLTARHVLSHSTGLPNWRFFRADGRLAFEAEPGARFGYSGEGFEWLARAIEAETGRAFPDLVEAYVLRPIGMEDTAFAVEPESFGAIAQPRDEEGVFHGHYCRPPGEGGGCREAGRYNAAADMVTSVADYAAFLGAVLDAEGYGPAMAADRDTVHTEKRGDDRSLRCTDEGTGACPAEQGYGLGFEVMAFEEGSVIGHGGWDWSQLAVAYAYGWSGDGVIVFLNAPNERARAVMPDLIALLDPLSPFLQGYERVRPVSEVDEAE